MEPYVKTNGRAPEPARRQPRPLAPAALGFRWREERPTDGGCRGMARIALRVRRREKRSPGGNRTTQRFPLYLQCLPGDASEPIEERAPSGWSRLEPFPTPRDSGFYGLGWERRRQGSEELTDWVGFGWWCLGKHDYLLDPRDRPGNPCRWIGWWKPGTEHLSAEETRLFDQARTILDDHIGGLLDRSLLDGEPHHDDGWPYYHAVPAAEVNALRTDTDEFATALSKLLPLIRRAV
jgi:hypothetical protein